MASASIQMQFPYKFMFNILLTIDSIDSLDGESLQQLSGDRVFLFSLTCSIFKATKFMNNGKVLIDTICKSIFLFGIH